MGSSLTIGQFAKRSGLSPRALRIYEAVGLIRSGVRAENNYRYYDESQLELTERIKMLTGLGFKLREVRAILLIDREMDTQELRKYLSRRLEAVSSEHSELLRQRTQLESILASLDQGAKVLNPTERSFVMEQIEKRLPFISVRDLVLFPGMQQALFVGRAFSIAAIERALTDFGGSIIIGTQKFAEMNDKPDPEQIFDVACACRVLKSERLGDGALKVLVKVEERRHVIDVVDVESTRYCESSPMSANTGKIKEKLRFSILQKLEAIKVDTPKWGAMIEELRSVEDTARFLMLAGGLTTSHRIRRELREKDKDLFIFDSLTAEEKASMNTETARLQEVLAEANLTEACAKLEALLA